jgi:hypothetical protein
MRKDPFGFAVAIALCTATVTAITDAKAADGRGRHWVGGYSHGFRHGVFRHGHQRQRFEPNLDFWQWGDGWWAGYHYCGGWAYQYGYAPHSCYIFGGG